MFSTYFARHKGCTLAVLALLALLLAACGGSNTNTTVGTTLSGKATATATPTKMVVGGNSATATLKHEPTGTVNLNWDNNSHQLTTKIMMTGLAPNSVHPANIYQESCATSQNYNKSTKPVHSLANITADSHGVVNSTTKTTVPDGIPAKNWSIVVYNGPTLNSSAETATLACADVVNHDTSLRSPQMAQATFQGTRSGNENVSGNATLSLSNRTLTVKMTVTGLVPNSEHMVHIHAGTCGSQGPVVYPLQVLKADASGKATTTTNIPNVMTIPASGWYINVHDSTDISTQTGFDPITCGDIKLK